MNVSDQPSKELCSIISQYRNRLALKKLLSRLTRGLFPGVTLALLFQLLSLFVPFYHVHLCSLLAVGLSLIAALLYHLLHPVSMEKSALYLDSFGLKEGMITAYENREKEGLFLTLQRQQALSLFQKKKADVTVSYLPRIRELLTLSLLLLVCIALTFVPTTARQQALETHELQEEVKEKQKEIKETLKDLDRLDTESLSPEELKALEDMKNALASSYQEFGQISKPQDLQGAKDRLDFKMAQLSSMANSGLLPGMNNGMQMANGQTPGSNTPDGNQGNNGSDGQNGQNQNGQGQNSQGQNGQAQNGQGQNQGGQDQGQGSQSGQNQGQGSQNGQDQGQGSQNGQDQGQGGQNGQDQGNGSQNGQDQGQSQGQGQNNGGGDGQNPGQNQNNGNSGGSGRGEGTASISRDYISVPNRVGNDENLTGTGQASGTDEFFLGQNGLNWEGDHTPYQEVIGSYQEKAYEGLTTGRYPSGMENLIKDYFSSFN